MRAQHAGEMFAAELGLEAHVLKNVEADALETDLTFREGVLLIVFIPSRVRSTPHA